MTRTAHVPPRVTHMKARQAEALSIRARSPITKFLSATFQIQCFLLYQVFFNALRVHLRGSRPQFPTLHIFDDIPWLTWIKKTDLISSELDQILEFVHDEEMFILVIVTQISRVKPAFAVNNLLWSVSVVQITCQSAKKVIYYWLSKEIRNGPRLISFPFVIGPIIWGSSASFKDVATR